MPISGPRGAAPLRRLVSVLATSIARRRRSTRSRTIVPSETAVPTRLEAVIRESPTLPAGPSATPAAPAHRPGAAAVGLVAPSPRPASAPGASAVGGGRVPEVITRVPDFPQTSTPAAPDGGDPTARRGAGARGAATVRIDVSDGRRITIRGTSLLGRGPVPGSEEDVAQLITVRDPALSVSKTHVAIMVDDRGAWVVDRGSTNGTVVTLPDGQQVICVPEHRVRVRRGARVLIGDVSSVIASAD